MKQKIAVSGAAGQLGQELTAQSSTRYAMQARDCVSTDDLVLFISSSCQDFYYTVVRMGRW